MWGGYRRASRSPPAVAPRLESLGASAASFLAWFGVVLRVDYWRGKFGATLVADPEFSGTGAVWTTNLDKNGLRFRIEV